MPPPSDILFQVITSLTGGLVTDLTTALVALLAISFLVFGIDILREAFETSIQRKNTNSSLDRARSYKQQADLMDDQVSKDYLNARYRSEIRRAAK